MAGVQMHFKLIGVLGLGYRAACLLLLCFTVPDGSVDLSGAVSVTIASQESKP